MEKERQKFVDVLAVLLPRTPSERVRGSAGSPAGHPWGGAEAEAGPQQDPLPPLGPSRTAALRERCVRGSLLKFMEVIGIKG